MSGPMVEFTSKIDKRNKAGSSEYIGETIAKGVCPHCDHRVSFRQIGLGRYGAADRFMIPLLCASCNSISVGDAAGNKLYPQPKPDGIDNLPEDVSRYYDEALSCIQAQSPNGATTLFRKTIHAIAIHYEIAEVDDNMRIYTMIKRLNEEGHINSKLQQSLLAVKDLGNDGAHINENEPDMEQALAVKSLIDATLNSTIKTDQHVDFAREAHPNDFK